MADRPRAGVAPWITAGVLGVVFAVLLAIYLVALRPDRAKAAPGQLTNREQTAVNEAARESANLLSYRRTHFDADFARTLAGTTGSMHSDVAKQKSSLRATVVKQKVTLSATVTHTGLVGPTSKGSSPGYVVLVTLNGYKSTAPDVPTPQNLQVTVVDVHDRWLIDDVQSVGVS